MSSCSSGRATRKLPGAACSRWCVTETGSCRAPTALRFIRLSHRAPGDIVITKKRVSAFAASDLECVLRASGRTHLVLFGIATSGVVLSTIRAAADMDYTMNVVSDCCADREPDVHQFLIDRVFPRMAPAITADEFIAAIAG